MLTFSDSLFRFLLRLGAEPEDIRDGRVLARLEVPPEAVIVVSAALIVRSRILPAIARAGTVQYLIAFMV